MRILVFCGLFGACGGAPAPTPAAVPVVAPPVAPVAAPAAPTVADGACDVGAFTRVVAGVHEAPGRPQIGELPADTEVQIVEHQMGWIRIKTAWNAQNEDAELPVGWVKAELLTTGLKTPDEYGPDAKPELWSDAAGTTREPIELSPRPTVVISGCEGAQLAVVVSWPGGKKATGYLPMDQHCPSTVTTCN